MFKYYGNNNSENYFVERIYEMSNQANTYELLLEAYWKIQGYWTKVRFPYDANDKERKKDFDLIAYDPGSKTLVVGEAKAQNTINRVYIYHSGFKNSDFHVEFKGYTKFISEISNLWTKDDLIFSVSEEFKKKQEKEEIFKENVNKLVIHLLSNTYIEESCRNDITKNLKKKFIDENNWKFDDIKIEIEIDNFMDLFMKIFEIQIGRKQSRSYDNHILDFIWEFHRYFEPKFQGFCGNKYDGKNLSDARKKADDIKHEYFLNISTKFNTLINSLDCETRKKSKCTK